MNTIKISCVILSGGRAARMGGINKGLALLNNQPLIQHVIERLAPQVDDIMINANREIAHYQTFHFAVLQDPSDEFLGPLSGILLGLQHAKHNYVLTVPCDSPLFPDNLAIRLLRALLAKNADIAVASSMGNAHPVFCLCKKSVLSSLEAYLNAGERKVSVWQKSQAYIEVDFRDCDAAFTNLNTYDELDALALKLSPKTQK